MDYPKMLHKGGPVDPSGYDLTNIETVVVEDGDADAAARADGYMTLQELAAPRAKKGKADA